jgi:DNA-3-methyladenine glycosylase
MVERALLGQPVDIVAPRLLGTVVEHRGGKGGRASVAVRITEVEAYAGVGADPASHAHRGPTARNAPMFSGPGHLYVYFVYGRHWCLNVVCGSVGEASAVLLRAGEVVRGRDVARERRGELIADHELARGPANLSVALGLTGEANGIDLLDPSSAVRLQSPTDDAQASCEVACGPRVGIRRAADRPWRWRIEGDPTVSRHPGVRRDATR